MTLPLGDEATYAITNAIPSAIWATVATPSSARVVQTASAGRITMSLLAEMIGTSVFPQSIDNNATVASLSIAYCWNRKFHGISWFEWRYDVTLEGYAVVCYGFMKVSSQRHALFRSYIIVQPVHHTRGSRYGSRVPPSPLNAPVTRPGRRDMTRSNRRTKALLRH